MPVSDVDEKMVAVSEMRSFLRRKNRGQNDSHKRNEEGEGWEKERPVSDVEVRFRMWRKYRGLVYGEGMGRGGRLCLHSDLKVCSDCC